MRNTPVLTAEVAAQKSLLGAFKYGLPYLAFLAGWCVLGAIANVLRMDSALLRLGVLIGPLGALLVGVPMLLQGLGAARSARAFEALLETPERIQTMHVSSTQRRGKLRHWLVVKSVDGAPMELMLRGAPDALWSELSREFPQATLAGRQNSSTVQAPPPDASRPARSFRLPRDLVLVNAADMTIESSVVVVGSGAKRFARALLQATGGGESEPEREGEMEHVVMKLGPIRGWTTRLFVYALDGSAGGNAASDLVATADAVVLVQTIDEGARLELALLPLAKAARANNGMLAFVGPKSALDDLAREASVQPDVVSHDGDSGAMLVLKQVTRRVLARLPANRGTT